ncbi:NmrA family NAD(P)-binding protein [uncultured Jatrophihabitans sp.]|uniref:NmrA family NAD(P)-binding protein n=1 Tax=uncultured Jatrophihabitans sp. TaxID=1610747 RepID=UPI0035CB90E1
MTSSDPRPVVVLGATGQQGGAVVDALLDAGASVRAVVRDATSDRSVALAGRGVDVVTGDQDEPDSLRGPFADVSALFLMTTFAESGGTDAETRRGRAVVDAAAAAGVPRAVYSSVGGAERGSGVPHFESKRRVEEHAESVLDCQFVRPAFFMENLSQQLDLGSEDPLVLRLPMPGDVPLQMISVVDIGKVAAAALLDPAALGGTALEIAGDERTGEQMAATVGRVLGRDARYEAVPTDTLDDDLAAMFRWFVDTPAYEADFARTREIDPGVLDLAGWVTAHRSG